MKRFLLLILAAGLAVPAFADTITMTLSPNIEFTQPGGISDPTCQNGSLKCVIFSGSVTSDSAQEWLLVDLQVTFHSPAPTLATDTNFFFANGPAFVANFEPYTGPIFDIIVDPVTLPGVFNGTATLYGVLNPGDTPTPLASAEFTVAVVPEPSTWLTALAAILLAAAYRKRALLPAPAKCPIKLDDRKRLGKS